MEILGWLKRLFPRFRIKVRLVAELELDTKDQKEDE